MFHNTKRLQLYRFPNWMLWRRLSAGDDADANGLFSGKEAVTCRSSPVYHTLPITIPYQTLSCNILYLEVGHPAPLQLVTCPNWDQ